MTDAKKPIGIYNPDFIAVMDNETFVYVKGLIEENKKLLVRIEKLREGLSEIENEHPDCMCDSYDFESWVICPKCLSLKILKQDDEAKNE